MRKVCVLFQTVGCGNVGERPPEVPGVENVMEQRMQERSWEKAQSPFVGKVIQQRVTDIFPGQFQMKKNWDSNTQARFTSRNVNTQGLKEMN